MKATPFKNSLEVSPTKKYQTSLDDYKTRILEQKNDQDAENTKSPTTIGRQSLVGRPV